MMTLIVIDGKVERQIAVFCENIKLRDKVRIPCYGICKRRFHGIEVY